MIGFDVVDLGVEAAALAVLCFIAMRLRADGAAAAAQTPDPTPPISEPEERTRTMSLSQNERRRHGLALVRRTIASGKYSKKDVARWEDEFGAETVQGLLPEDSKSAPSSSSTSSKSKE